MKRDMSRDMTQGSVVRTVLLFMLPIFLGQLLQMTYNVVDSMVVGRFVSEAALAAVAATYTPITFFNALVLGFSTGASIVIAQLFGAKDQDGLRKSFSTTYICVFIGGLIMTAVVFFLARPLLKYVLNTPEEDGVLDQAVLYLRVYYAGAVFVFLYNMFASALRAIGDSVYPLVFLIVSCVANIVLDLVLVLAFHMGVAGVALASVLSQALAVICAIVYIRARHKIMWYKPSELRFDKKIFRLSLQQGIPAAINSCISSFCFMWQQRLVNGFGPQAMAAFLAGQRVDQLVGMPLIITGTSMSPFAGQNVGAGKWDRVYEGRRKIIFAGLIFVFTCTPLLLIFGKQILSLFVADPNSMVITYAYDYLWRICPFYVCLCINMVTNGVMTGAGDAKYGTFNSMLGLAFRIGAAYVLAFGFDLGLNGVWLSTGVGFALGLLPSQIRFYSGAWKKKAIVKQQAAK